MKHVNLFPRAFSAAFKMAGRSILTSDTRRNDVSGGYFQQSIRLVAVFVFWESQSVVQTKGNTSIFGVFWQPRTVRKYFVAIGAVNKQN